MEDCRTCATNRAINLYELSSHMDQHPEKLISEILMELAIINTKFTDKIRFPQQICEKCLEDLKNAYNFVKQAQQRQIDLMTIVANNLHNTSVEKNEDSLAELKIENDMEDCGANGEFHESIIIEKPNETSPYNDEELLDPLIMPVETTYNEKLQDLNIDNLSNDGLDVLPLQRRKKIFSQKKKQTEMEKAFKCDKCHKSYFWEQSLKSHVRKHLAKSEWYPCSHCQRKFYRKDGLLAHLRTHGGIAKMQPKRTRKRCEESLCLALHTKKCKPHGMKVVQCMICFTKFNRIAQLRQHLQEHAQTILITKQEKVIFSEIASTLYPDLKNTTEKQLVERICDDLKANRYERFSSITNEWGYELSLESSETESETELVTKESSVHRIYNCELCNVDFHRKYELFEHQRLAHKWQDAPYCCVRCSARFVSKQILDHHYKSQCKNMLKRYMCKKCPLRFSWKHNLKLHYRSHRVEVETLECTACDRIFESKKALTIHMRIDHIDASKLLACQWCERKFYRQDLYEKHLKRHGFTIGDVPLAETLLAATAKANGQKNINCKICNLKFARITDLRAHLLIEIKLGLSHHQSYDSLQNYSITNAYGYELHIEDSETDDDMPYRSNHKITSVYTCELCQVQCKRKFEMMRHQFSIHRFDKIPNTCELCIFKTVSKPILEYHRKTQCLNSVKAHTCFKCGYKFMWPDNLNEHVRVQHLIKENVENHSLCPDKNSTVEEMTTRVLQCPHCERTFVRLGSLNNHIRDVHSEGNERKKKEAPKKFLCSHCGKELRSSADLVVHVRRHTGEKPYKCDMCEMAFARHCDLTGHRRKHTGEKPFNCTVCGKDFARSDKLKVHMLTHSGLKPYNCTYCDQSFRYTQHLKQHLLQHTGEFQFQCGVCGERFLQNSALNTHRMIRGHFEEIQ